MQLRKLTEQERIAHLLNHPEDEEYDPIYEVKYFYNGQWQQRLINDNTAHFIEAALQEGRRQVQHDIRVAMGIERKL